MTILMSIIGVLQKIQVSLKPKEIQKCLPFLHSLQQHLEWQQLSFEMPSISISCPSIKLYVNRYAKAGEATIPSKETHSNSLLFASWPFYHAWIAGIDWL